MNMGRENHPIRKNARRSDTDQQTSGWIQYASIPPSCSGVELIVAEWRIYASPNQATMGSDYGLWPGRCQAIIWTNAGILLIWPLGTNFSESAIEIHTFNQENEFENVVWKIADILSRPHNVLLNHVGKRTFIPGTFSTVLSY